MSKQMATVSSAGDAVPFEAACSLSSGLIILAAIRIYGYFQPAQRRPWQLAISGISFASSASTLGMVFSKAYRRHEGVHLGLLLWNSGILGMYEAECLLVLLGKLRPRLVKGFYWILAVIWLLMVVGLICIAVQNPHPQSIWIVLLSVETGAVYILLCIGSTILCSQSMATTTRVLLLCLAAPCPLPLVVSASLLGGNAAGSISGRLVLSAWVFFALSSVCTTRYQLLRPLRLFKCLGRSSMELGAQFPSILSTPSNFPNHPPDDTEEHGNTAECEGLDEELGNPFGNYPSRQESMTALVAPSAVHVYDSRRKG